MLDEFLCILHLIDLVMLVQRSGRVDEEIAMLHHKLKQIEDGITFVGRSTKQARSQGRKIQITAEQEISRCILFLNMLFLHFVYVVYRGLTPDYESLLM